MKTKKTFYSEIENKVHDFFNSLNIDISINDYINIENIIDIDNLESFDASKVFDEITNILDDHSAFNLEIIYYSNAIDYLKENDPSLNNSLAIAAEYGFELQDIDSEKLASLLYTQIETENYYNLESETTDFFSDIETEINNFLESTEVMKRETRCKKCNKLLFYSDKKKDSRIIEIKCNKCKQINIIKI